MKYRRTKNIMSSVLPVIGIGGYLCFLAAERALKSTPGRQVVNINAPARRTDRFTIGFRPAQPAEPMVCRFFPLGENRFERQGPRGGRQEKMLRHMNLQKPRAFS